MLVKIVKLLQGSRKTMINVISSTIAMVSAQQSEETKPKDTLEDGVSSDTDDNNLM